MVWLVGRVGKMEYFHKEKRKNDELMKIVRGFAVQDVAYS